MYYIIVYEKTFDTMNAEDKFKELNIKCTIMPAPTSIGHSCGICTRLEDKDVIDKIISEKIVNYKDIYEKTEEGFVIYG